MFHIVKNLYIVMIGHW